MAASRKLFLTHAGELAHRLMQDVYRGGLVARFVRAYAEQYGRYGLLSETERLSELESTIGREALLVMAAGVRRILLPQAFAARDRKACCVLTMPRLLMRFMWNFCRRSRAAWIGRPEAAAPARHAASRRCFTGTSECISDGAIGRCLSPMAVALREQGRVLSATAARFCWTPR